MEIASIATISLGATALIGVITLLLTKIVGKSSKTKLFDIFKKKVTEDQEQEKIKEISKEQEIIINQIKLADKFSEETKKKVREKVREAAKDIQKILNQDTISTINKQIDEDWEDI